MAFPGARVIILCCFFLHISVVNVDYFVYQGSTNLYAAFFCFVQGGTLLLYPLVGILGYNCFTRYKIFTVSIILLLVSSLLNMIVLVALLILSEVNISYLFPAVPWYFLLMAAVLIIAMLLSLGMFEAVAIQFGMDQMVEASSDQISTFIHWYYWSVSAGFGVVILVGAISSTIVTVTVRNHIVYASRVKIFLCMMIPTILTQITALIVSFVLLRIFKSHLTVEPAGDNPFSIVCKVLKYTWQHKVPERRSAFTYWEEDIPPRIDLGKNKYGGPFTTEEVEDVKTFLLLFSLLVSLFGFHLAENGYPVLRELNYKLCPSPEIFAFVTLSPNVFQAMTVVACFPLLHYVIVPRFRKIVPNMLHRIGIGTVLIFLKELAEIVIIMSSWEEYATCPYHINKSSTSKSSPIADCYYHDFKFSIPTMRQGSQCKGDHLFLGLTISILVQTIAYQLVFMTVLEFLSAQSPLKMKGLLISTWYALSSQRYVLQGMITLFVTADELWMIVHAIKALLILLSVILYCCLAKHYRYRLRDEVVNEHYLVEEVYDRELRLAEEYEREKREELRQLYTNK